jgi:hypothetical protein
MPVTITGGRYAIRSLSAVGTTTVTIGTGTFVSGDFGANQRMVALFTSANVFKGIAWVRRFTSTTVLELENRFVDPITGLYVNQLVNDQVLVSKNSAESAATGFTVTTPDNNVVTVSDNILMGTGGVETSLCFYDENKQFTMTNGFRFNGGVAVFGKLVSYDGVSKESFVWSRECTARPNESYPAGGGDPAFNIWGTGGTTGHMFFFGGALGSPMRRSFFIGAQTTGATCGSFAMFGTRIYYAAASPNNGGNWSANAERHLLYKTIHEADYNNANLIVWGNGAFQGSFLSFPQFGAGTPLGIFRASSAVTFGASANNRTIVNDTGSGAFIDDINNGSYTFTNVITPAVNIVRFAGGNVPITFQFSDDYTNLQPRTTVVIRRGDGTIVSSVVNTSSSTFTATVVQATYSATANGTATPTNFYTTFNYGIKCYGFNVVNGTHTPYTYSLGTAGNGTDLKLGGLINQLVDSNVTLTETQALALSSKFSINTGTNTITVTGNATYDELYDYVVAWNCSSAANAVIPNLSQYLITANGQRISAFTGWSLVVNTGVTLSSGEKFGEVYFDTITLNGTGQITAVYATTAGTSTVLELNPPSDDYSLCIFRADGTTKYFASGVDAGSYYVYFAPNEAETYFLAAEKYGQRRTEDTLVLNGGNVWYNITDQEDVGITDDFATASAYTTLSTTSQIYDATAVFRLSEAGIKLGQLVARDGLYLDFANYNVKIKDDATAIIAVASGTITYKSIVVNSSAKYNAMKATPPKTITPTDNELINVLIEDANGDSQVSILGGDNLGYELWKVTTATATDDYATGTLLTTLATNAAPYRFIGISGFDIVGRDVSSGVRRRSSMLKGSYTQAFYVGDQIQLATNAPQLIENNEKLDELILKVETNLDAKVSTRLADADYINPATPQDVTDAKAEVLTAISEIPTTDISALALETTAQSIKSKVDTLENADFTTTNTLIIDLGNPLQAEDYIAPDNTTIGQIKSKVDTLENTDLTGIATATNVTDAKNEIIAEIGNIDVDLTGVALEETSQEIKTKVLTLSNYDDGTAQSKLDDIKSKVDTLENTDLTEVTEDLTIINNGVKKASLLIPHTDNI